MAIENKEPNDKDPYANNRVRLAGDAQNCETGTTGIEQRLKMVSSVRGVG